MQSSASYDVRSSLLLGDTDSELHTPATTTLAIPVRRLPYQDEPEQNAWEIRRLQLLFHGALVVTELSHPGLTHVVASSSLRARVLLEEISRLPSSDSTVGGVAIVMHGWVDAACKHGALLIQDSFIWDI